MDRPGRAFFVRRRPRTRGTGACGTSGTGAVAPGGGIGGAGAGSAGRFPAEFPAEMGIIGGSAKLSLSDSSHLTAEAPAGKLGPGLLNFNTHKDCSWHVR